MHEHERHPRQRFCTDTSCHDITCRSSGAFIRSLHLMTTLNIRIPTVPPPSATLVVSASTITSKRRLSGTLYVRRAQQNYPPRRYYCELFAQYDASQLLT